MESSDADCKRESQRNGAPTSVSGSWEVMLTRRKLLGGGTALLTTLAGCNTSPRQTSTVDPWEPGAGRRPENVAMDPPSVTLRRSGGYREPIVSVPDTEENLQPTEREWRRAVKQGFVASQEAASMLRIEDIAGVQRAREFLAETDFEREFVFVDRASVPQCYKRLLCYVTWTAAELRLTYGEVYRDYDVACRTDSRDRVARFIRLQGDIDPRRIETGGTMTRRGGCPIPRWRRSNERGTGSRELTATSPDATTSSQGGSKRQND